MPVAYQLEPSEFDRVRSLLRDLDFHLSIKALLAGTAAGAAYVDDRYRPDVALAQVGRRLFLSGPADGRQPTGAGSVAFLGEAWRRARPAVGHGVMLYFAPDGWEESIRQALPAFPPHRRLRHYYRFQGLRHQWRSLLPPGFQVRAVDGDLLADGGLRNVDRLRADVCSEGPSVEHYLRHRFGFCVLTGAEIVAWCLSEYNSGLRIELGIETVEEYQRQGLATVAASAVVEHALDHGVTQIGWHCYSAHAASIATARKVGFEKVCEYPVYWVPSGAVAV